MYGSQEALLQPLFDATGNEEGHGSAPQLAELP